VVCATNSYHGAMHQPAQLTSSRYYNIRSRSIPGTPSHHWSLICSCHVQPYARISARGIRSSVLRDFMSAWMYPFKQDLRITSNRYAGPMG
jgi:hypothetical protein